MNTKRRLLRAVVTAVAAAVTASCAFLSSATSSARYGSLDAGVEAGSFSGALAAIENSRASLYPAKNRILYHLDKGVLEHYAGGFAASSKDLEEAERLIGEAFTKSVTQEISTYIANDNTRDYSGEDYEDVYINVFNALNYYHRGDLEGALVEIRRVNDKLAYLGGKYAASKARVKAEAEGKTKGAGVDFSSEPVRFSDSALARYLGVLFYRGSGNADDARIDSEALHAAYAAAPSIYRSPPPQSLAEELHIPAGKARLNVIAFAGLSPVKEEFVTTVPLPFAPPHHFAKLALPRMAARPSLITRVEAVIDDGPSFELELVEDMGLVTLETFKARFGLVYAKTLTRTIVKNAASAAATAASNDDDIGGGAALALMLLGIGGKIAADVSEQADTRVSRYFPGRALAGGVTLAPGVYSCTVNYYGEDEFIRSVRRENIEVEEDKLNLVEAVCLR